MERSRSRVRRPGRRRPASKMRPTGPIAWVLRHRWSVLAAGVAVAAVGLIVAGLESRLLRGTITHCSEGGIEGFDPASMFSTTVHTLVGYPLYSPLVESPVGGRHKIVPGLAERWTVSPDGLTYRFFLRRNVAFHSTPWFTPTRTMNADDVLFTFNRMLDRSHPFAFDDRGRRLTIDELVPTWVASVRRIDDYTVEVTARSAEAPVLGILSEHKSGIISAEYGALLLARGTRDPLRTHPVGTGPFQLRAYEPDKRVSYEANPRFWQKGLPRIRALTFLIEPDAGKRLDMLRTGQCSVASLPRPSDLQALREDTSLRLVQTASWNVGKVAYNLRQPPFDQLAFRQALDLAINRQDIVDQVFGGSGVPASSMVAPGMQGYDASARARYDPAAARALLAQVRLPKGFEIELLYPSVQRVYNPDALRTAQLIAADWARIGLRVRLANEPLWDRYLKRIGSSAFQAALDGLISTGNDPEELLFAMVCASVESGLNTSSWCDPEFDRLTDRAANQQLKEIDRVQALRAAVQRMQQAVPASLLAHGTIVLPMRGDVKNVQVYVDGTVDYARATVQ